METIIDTANFEQVTLADVDKIRRFLGVPSRSEAMDIIAEMAIKQNEA